MPDKSAETIDKDGWAHTGDIGYWNENGNLVIFDRKKNIFKLAQGEYIAPEKIELVLGKHELVAQSFVYGDSLQASLVAVVVPDPDQLPAWAKAEGINGDLAELCKNEKVIKHYLTIINSFSKENNLKGFEIPRAVHLDPVPFSVENEILTPTFKLKRNVASDHYASVIKELYEVVNGKAKD